MEAAIQAAEEAVTKLEVELGDPELYKSRGADVPRLTADLDAKKSEVERLYARWSDLEARRTPS
jgi:hypothetical protein